MFQRGSECRMKLPAYASTETLVMFDDKVTSWFAWRGNDISRSLSICVPKRAHADAYVNVHSEFASILFGCNTNVITGVDGGSVMYCTCYVSKNTEREDNKHFADAAKHMVKNMQQQMAERKGLSDVELEEEASSVGLKCMFCAALMATKVHKVAASMASYLIRNGSRFHFSHDFSYVDIGSFFKAIQEDLNISADEDGSVFLKSSVSNYLCRPKELEELNGLGLGLNLERWRKVYQDGKLSRKHEQFLMNIQDCWNSMNGGRPVDMIERLTGKPVKGINNDRYDVEKEDGDDILNEAMDQFFLSESFELGYDDEFRDSRGRFQCQSILARSHGSHRCGKNLVVCPNVQSSERFIVVEGTETKSSETNETDFSKCNRHLNVKALNELAIKVVTSVVDKNGRAIDMGVNGTFKMYVSLLNFMFCVAGNGKIWQMSQSISRKTICIKATRGSQETRWINKKQING
ncbi:hypothetical protein IV203_019642 [Nitzschia inconspicua]|uniref:Uncharacterized protein n=1 Tax=Nitzschia inconspicua TaxID=303405 RepID=A0A9K3LZH8_9STRA|nr:hypothetical protein IV203_019642 [Nitzschia inconspicua]